MCVEAMFALVQLEVAQGLFVRRALPVPLGLQCALDARMPPVGCTSAASAYATYVSSRARL
jgi:hypothetical protein